MNCVTAGSNLNDSGSKWLVEQIQKSVTTPFLTELPFEGRQKLLSLMEQYNNYKTNYARNYVFDPSLQNLSITRHSITMRILLLKYCDASPSSSRLVHHLWFITSGASRLVHDLWCMTSGTRPRVHDLGGMTSGA